MKSLVLWIGADALLAGETKFALAKSRFEITYSADARLGLKKLQETHWNAVIVEDSFKDIEGLEICKQIAEKKRLPTIFISKKTQAVPPGVLALPSPLNTQDLLNCLKQKQQNASISFFEVEDLKIDFLERTAKVAEKVLELTQTEFEVLSILAQAPDQTFHRDRIAEELQRKSWDATQRSIDILISRLRKKLKDDPKHPKYIGTVRGTGYFLKSS